MRAKNPRFEVYESMKNPNAPHRWRLYARNGEIIASGEGYTTKKDAERAVRAVKRAVLAIVEQESGE